MHSRVYLKTCGEGAPLLCLHGWGFDHRIWGDLVARLGHRYQCLLVDLPGMGQTPDMDWESFKKALLQVLPQKCLVLGWSLGGLYATRLAIEAPHRVSKLINVASSPKFLAEDAWPGIEKSVLDDFHQKVQRNPLATMSAFVAMQRTPLDPTLLPEQEPSSLGLLRGVMALGEWDLREALHHLTMPVAYHFGRWDSIVPYSVLSVMKIQYPQFNFYGYPKSGHLPFLSDAEQLILRLSDGLCAL